MVSWRTTAASSSAARASAGYSAWTKCTSRGGTTVVGAPGGCASDDGRVTPPALPGTAPEPMPSGGVDASVPAGGIDGEDCCARPERARSTVAAATTAATRQV